MAASTLLLRLQLRCRPTRHRVDKHRIVAKPPLTGPDLRDGSLPHTFRDHRIRVIGSAHKDYDAAEPGRTLVRWRLVQGLEKLCVIRGGVRSFASVPGRLDSWLATQRVHLQTGVIGYGGQARRSRRVSRFDQRILEQAMSGFRDLVDTQIRLRQQVPKVPEQSLKLT